MSAHTPGPWKVGQSDGAIPGYTDIDAEDWGALASVATSNVDAIEEGRANARLISAAPELLEACRAAAAVIPLGEGILTLLDAAIAKATGKELAA